nr:acyltransferase [uncultured Pseudomonas sp.]
MNRRIADIEVLRAFAVLAVALYHVNGVLTGFNAPSLPWPFQQLGGWFGVDLFFAISGFVIARGLLGQMERPRRWGEAWPVIKVFWLRRFWRLIPSAWLWLAIMLLLSWLFNTSGVYGQVSANLEATLAGMLNVANARFAYCFGTCEFYSSFVYWSLSLEEQFYLLLPLLIFFVRGRWLPVLLGAWVLFQLAQARGLWLMAFRTDALLLGVLLAMAGGTGVYQRLKPMWLARRPLVAALILGAILANLAWLASPARGMYTYEVGAIAVLSAVLVWLASYDLDLFCRVRGLREVLFWLGSRSYAIYLIHVPVYLGASEVRLRLFSDVDRAAPVFLAIGLPACLAVIAALAELNYRFVESPLRRYGVRMTSNMRNHNLTRSALPGVKQASTT